jgi:hypothetical protein
MSFSSKRGSLDTLNRSTRQGLRLWSFQMRATESLPMPWRLAISLVVQWVEPSSGVAWRVSSTTAATVPSGNQDFRPRPGAILPSPSTPSSAKRVRHVRTELALTPTRRAIS